MCPNVDVMNQLFEGHNLPKFPQGKLANQNKPLVKKFNLQ